ncbi:MAG: potassium-transporting ATPase subunit KdpC [Hyphomicrobium sp.]|nr:potassium-transporting ATPase subunit KdpC [Hyphomicrobium sp.]
MLSHLRPAAMLLAVMTLLTGLAYPLAMTGLIQVLAPAAANGSLVGRDGKTIGSSLIGQSFASERYVHGRLSAAGATGYDAAGSSGSNLGPTSKKLMERVTADVAKLKAEGLTVIPADAVTASGSGLDPDISPVYALAQAERVAKARAAPIAKVREITKRMVETPLWGLIGEPRVNVLRLNLALDEELGAGPS